MVAKLTLGWLEFICVFSRRLLLALPLQQFKQELRRQVSAIRPSHGAQHGVLASGGKQRRVAQRAKHLTFKLAGQIDLARLA